MTSLGHLDVNGMNIGNSFRKRVVTNLYQNTHTAKEINKTLLFFGVNEMSIDQDLDRLSEHLNKFVLS